MTIIAARYNQVEQYDVENLEEAVRLLRAWENDGMCYGLGIYDPEAKIMHLPDNAQIAGRSEAEVLEQKSAAFEGLGLDIQKFEFLKEMA